MIPSLPKKNNYAFTDLQRFLASDLEEMDKLMKARLDSQTKTIPDISTHILKAGGKKLRAMLTLASAHLLNYKGKTHISFATAIEFMHTATLLHDDVVDEATRRRGRITARLKWGNSASVLVGDFLLGQAFKLMVEGGNLKALGLLSEASVLISQGEVMQLSKIQDLKTTEDEYLNIIDAKTATLFATACEVGGMIANNPHLSSQTSRIYCNSLSSYGRNLGIAFQLIDDVLDYNGTDETGKNIGGDFREAKITLPLLLALRRGDKQDHRFWQRVIGDRKQKKGDLSYAIDLMEQHHAFTDSIARAKHYGTIAKNALTELPDNQWRKQLLALVDFCIGRAF